MLFCDIAQFYSPFGGGVKRYIQDKRAYLRENTSHQHLLIIPSDADRVDSFDEGLVYHVRSPRLPGSMSYRLLLRRERIRSICETERPDLIEVGDPYRCAWIGLQVAQDLGVPVMAFYHSDFPRAFGRTVEKYAGRWVGRVVSKWVHSYVVGLYNRMDATVVANPLVHRTLQSCGVQRLVHIPLGTDTRVFFPRADRPSLRRQLDLDPSTKVLLFVGRMAREKNIPSLLGMMDHLPLEKGPWLLVLVGEGEMNKMVETASRDRSDIRWIRYTHDREALAAWCTASDLFIHAGMHETFGLVLLEAQACGTPCLIVRDSGLQHALVDWDPSLEAHSPNPRDLARAVVTRLAVNGGKTEREERFRAVQERFSTVSTMRKLVRLQEYLVGRLRTPGSSPHPQNPNEKPRRSPLLST